MGLLGAQDPRMQILGEEKGGQAWSLQLHQPPSLPAPSFLFPSLPSIVSPFSSLSLSSGTGESEFMALDLDSTATGRSSLAPSSLTDCLWDPGGMSHFSSLRLFFSSQKEDDRVAVLRTYLLSP